MVFVLRRGGTCLGIGKLLKDDAIIIDIPLEKKTEHNYKRQIRLVLLKCQLSFQTKIKQEFDDKTLEMALFPTGI